MDTASLGGLEFHVHKHGGFGKVICMDMVYLFLYEVEWFDCLLSISITLRFLITSTIDVLVAVLFYFGRQIALLLIFFYC